MLYFSRPRATLKMLSYRSQNLTKTKVLKRYFAAAHFAITDIAQFFAFQLLQIVQRWLIAYAARFVGTADIQNHHKQLFL